MINNFVSPASLKESYMVLTLLSLLLLTLLYNIGYDSISYKSQKNKKAFTSTLLCSLALLFATGLLIKRKNDFSQPVLFVAEYTGDRNENYNITFLTNKLYIYKSNYFTSTYIYGNYCINSDEIILDGKLKDFGIATSFKTKVNEVNGILKKCLISTDRNSKSNILFVTSDNQTSGFSK